MLIPQPPSDIISFSHLISEPTAVCNRSRQSILTFLDFEVKPLIRWTKSEMVDWAEGLVYRIYIYVSLAGATSDSPIGFSIITYRNICSLCTEHVAANDTCLALPHVLIILSYVLGRGCVRGDTDSSTVGRSLRFSLGGDEEEPLIGETSFVGMQ